jgi:hypothetical protein
MTPFLVIGAVLLALTVVWWLYRPPRAVVSSYDFLGCVSWRWRAETEGNDGYPTRNAAMRAAEQAGYWVEE